MYYIPFTFKADGRPTSGIFQTVIAAEGIAPAAARTFVGMGDCRSGQVRFTGVHPLNPFEERLLLYSKLPVLPNSAEFADAWHMTAFVAVNEEDVCVHGSASNVLHLKSGMDVIQVVGAVMFMSPKDVSFIFADDTNYDFRMGLRATPNGKHEDSFRYSLLVEAQQEGNESVVLTKEDLEEIASIPFDEDDEAILKARASSEFDERLKGAEVGYALSKRCGGSMFESKLNSKRMAWRRFKESLAVLLVEDSVAEFVKNVAKAIVAEFESSSASLPKNSLFDFSRSSECAFADKSRDLLVAFCTFLCAHPFPDWNWSDNEMRAQFTLQVFEKCIKPLLIEKYGDKADAKTSALWNEMAKVKRFFDEPYTFLLDDKMLDSDFAAALWRVLNSEGRHDRIKEAMVLFPGEERSHMALALYGAMCGYAGFSTKKLLITSETNEGSSEEDWMKEVIYPVANSKENRSPRGKASDGRRTVKPKARKKSTSKKSAATVCATTEVKRQEELALGL